MLIDDRKHFVELMVDNIMWGNITIDWEKIRQYDTEEQSFSKVLSDYTTLRKKESSKPEIPPKMLAVINALSFEFEFNRLFGGITGVLIDREHENKIQELTQDNEKLVNTVSEQKERLDDLIDKATDTKNIRGIG